MAYWIDESFHSWPEIMRAGTPAAGLYCRCGAYVAQHLLDGLVPFEVAAQYGSKEWAQRLVDAGLWVVEEHGYRDARYFPLNPSAEKVAGRRQADAERKARWRERRDERRRANEMSRRDSRRTHTVSHGVSPDGIRSSLPPLKGGKGAPAPASRGEGGAPEQDPPPPCSFKPDTSGTTCTRCGLPAANNRHRGGDTP